MSGKETLEEFKKRVHEAALVKAREKHDSEGWFSGAPPHHIWKRISKDVNWDELAKVYVDREKCIVCGDERNYAWAPTSD